MQLLRALICAIAGHRWLVVDTTMDAEHAVCSRCYAERYRSIGDDGEGV